MSLFKKGQYSSLDSYINERCPLKIILVKETYFDMGSKEGEARAQLGLLRANRGKICRFTVWENFCGGQSSGWFSEFKLRID